MSASKPSRPSVRKSATSGLSQRDRDELARTIAKTQEISIVVNGLKMELDKQTTRLRAFARKLQKIDPAAVTINVTRGEMAPVIREQSRRPRVSDAPALVPDGSASEALAQAAQGGQSQLIEWTQDGTLLTSAEFADRRSVTPQALHKATTRGDLFSVKVKGLLYYPAALTDMPEDYVRRLCQTIKPLDAGQKLLFIRRKHGALGGLTIEEAVGSGKGERAIVLADAWAAEEVAAA